MNRLLSIIFICLMIVSKGQNLEIPAFGTESTFEVITWNIEWFPKNGETTKDYVKEIIEDLDADLVAMQELDDIAMFNQMMAEMDDYEGYYESGYFAGLAFIYKKESVQIDTIYEIYTTQPYWRPFPRSPMVMELTFLNDQFIVINNHFKCCGDEFLDLTDPWDEETRRYDASNLLEEYIRLNFQGVKVILTGDLNDNIADDFTNNVFGAFLDKPEDYLFTDMDIAEGPISNWSYPSWPSHLDHILITAPLFNAMTNSGSVTETLKLDEYFNSWNEYDANVTDHRPVAIRIDDNYSLGSNEIGINKNRFTVFPNPTDGIINIEADIPQGLKAQINIYSSLGILIDSKTITSFRNNISIDISKSPSGLFFAEFFLNGEFISVEKVIVN